MLQSTRSLLLRIGTALLAIWLAAAQSAAWSYDARPRFDQQGLDAMIAPIALYPDQLLSQVLMAATYPDEIEEAARWSRARPGLSGDAAVRSAQGWDWDPSVRSLTAFPQVLDTMARHMAWTEDLGRAFVVQPQDVMDTVQRLRFRAYDAGTLVSTETTRVVHTGSSIVIESVQPQVVYVPYYDTQVVYGPWWWPARPPMGWARWHGYHEPHGRPAFVYWGPGTALGAGFFFGGFDWPRREVRVVNTRSYYYVHRDHAPRFGSSRPHAHAAPHLWRHDHARREAWREQRRHAESAGHDRRRDDAAQRHDRQREDAAQRHDRQREDHDRQRGDRAQRRQVEAAQQQPRHPHAPQLRRDAAQSPAPGAIGAQSDDGERARERRVRRGPDADDEGRGRQRAAHAQPGNDTPAAQPFAQRRAPSESPPAAARAPAAAAPAGPRAQPPAVERGAADADEGRETRRRGGPNRGRD